MFLKRKGDSMKSLTGIALAALALGGVTLVSFSFNYTKEAQKLPTKAEKQEDADLSTKSKGEDAIQEGKYLEALQLFLTIPDDSTTVLNKYELVEEATKLYLSKVLKEIDNELDNNNFSKAENLLNEGLKVIPDNEELINKSTYVSLRKELYSLLQKEKLESIIAFINSHNDIFGNDKVVSEILGDVKEKYLNEVIKNSDNKCNDHLYNEARSILSAAVELIGDNNKIQEQLLAVNKKEAKYNISVFDEMEDWYGMYQYINSLTEVLKNDNLSSLKGARNHLLDEAIDESNKYLKKKEYDAAKTILSDTQEKIGEDKKINSQYDIIEKSIITDHITELKDNKLWRELIDYLNASSLNDEYKNEFTNAVSQYKSSLLKEANSYFESEDYQAAYNVLVPAYDILSNDDEYIELYNKYEQKLNETIEEITVVD